VDESSSQACDEATAARGKTGAFKKSAAGDEGKDTTRASESIPKRTGAIRKEAGQPATAYAPCSLIVESVLLVVYISVGIRAYCKVFATVAVRREEAEKGFP
jgi:hypothetical protein